MNGAILAIVAAVLAWSLTGLYLRIMTSYRRLEPPSERGMHTAPVPTGAGVAIVASVLVLWPISQRSALGLGDMVLLGPLAALAAISWFDDRSGLSPALRLLAHSLAVTILLLSLGQAQRVLTVIPLAVERVLLGLAWLWFINLFNFMDGIDGLAGAEAVAVAAGYVLVVTVAGLSNPLEDLALIIASATFGYLFWNWHPAKVFMGDTGSIALGFLLGWLMLDLACRGLWAAAAILPLYFVADATFTLVKRVLRREGPWQPHRRHFYQRAVMAGKTPSAIVLRVGVANAALVALAVLSVRYPVLALAGAAAVVAGLLANLEKLASNRP